MRHLLLLSVLMLAACWAAAQDSSQTTPANAGSQTGDGSQVTVQGCLGGSEGNYTLMSDDGTSYRLTGNTAKLKDHVGHEMTITGAASSSNSNASNGMGEEAGNNRKSGMANLEVGSFKHVAKTCKNNGMSH